MSRFKISFRNIVYGVMLVALDVFVYLLLGLLLMSYDDQYDASKGAYFSWKSMAPVDRAAYVALHLWHVVNAAALVYVVYRIYKRAKLHKAPSVSNGS